MRKILIVLCAIILFRITSFSSTILTDSIPVAVTDIKKANLIFLEHKKLLIDNSLLREQIDNLNKLNYSYQQVDSLRILQVEEYDRLNKDYLKSINKLNKDINKKNQKLRNWQIGSVVISLGLILVVLFK